MKKQIHVYYSVRVNLERVIEVDADFEFNQQKGLKAIFKQLARQFPDENLNNLEDVEIESSKDLYGQDSFKLDGIDVITFNNQKIESNLITK
jgi:hypothetical protein